MPIHPDFDPNSPTWRAMKAYIADRLDRARAALETEGASLAETENARGRVSELKSLLGLGDRGPEIPDSGTPYS